MYTLRGMDDAELKRTASLAYLELKEDEIAGLRDAVTQMIEYFETMSEFDIGGLEATTHAVPGRTPLRPDAAETREGTGELVGNAPEHNDGMIIIPGVLP